MVRDRVVQEKSGVKGPPMLKEEEEKAVSHSIGSTIPLDLPSSSFRKGIRLKTHSEQDRASSNYV